MYASRLLIIVHAIAVVGLTRTSINCAQKHQNIVHPNLMGLIDSYLPRAAQVEQYADKTVIPYATFQDAGQACIKLQKNQMIKHAIDKTTAIADNQFFAQRLLIPVGSTVHSFGDLHGDARALARCLQKLQETKIVDQNFKVQKGHYLIFKGDFVDRGLYGVEVLYTLMRLRNINSQQVFLIRGNHEDIDINGDCGFITELAQKFGQKYLVDIVELMREFYNYLPAVIYIGTTSTSGPINYIQCCHGGIENGYHPETLLTSNPTPLAFERIKGLQQLTHAQELFKEKPELHKTCSTLIDNFQDLHESQLVPGNIGYMWNDFNAQDEQTSFYNNARGFQYGQPLAEAVLQHQQSQKTFYIRAVVRAHQHNDTMAQLFTHHGFYQLEWKQPIFTCVSAPVVEPSAPEHTFQACFISIQTAPEFTQWKLTHHWHNAIFKPRVKNQWNRKIVTFIDRSIPERTEVKMSWAHRKQDQIKALVKQYPYHTTALIVGSLGLLYLLSGRKNKQKSEL